MRELSCLGILAAFWFLDGPLNCALHTLPTSRLLVLRLEGSPSTGLTRPVYWNWRPPTPEVNQTVYVNLQPSNGFDFLKATQQRLQQDILQFPLKDIFSYLIDGQGLLYLPPIQKVLNENTLGGSAPQTPIYVLQGIAEEVAPVTNVDKTISKYCEEHAPSIKYIKNTGEDYLGSATGRSAAAIEWLKEIMGGSISPSGSVASTTATRNATVTASANGSVTGKCCSGQTGSQSAAQSGVSQSASQSVARSGAAPGSK